jgi:hypothetical protein
MARRAIVEDIAWYNGTRLHSTLGSKTPAEFEEQDKLRKVAEPSHQPCPSKRGNPKANVQKRKSSRTRWVFWIMKTSSSPTPLSEAIAPPPSRRPSAGGLVLLLGLSWTMTALLGATTC